MQVELAFTSGDDTLKIFYLFPPCGGCGFLIKFVMLKQSKE